MPSNKWLDKMQPQTLVSATLLMYINAALDLLFNREFVVSVLGVTVVSVLLGLLVIAGQVAGGWGIANERRWGYWLAVVIAVVLLVDTIVSFSGGLVVTLLFEIVLVALLLHPQSRDYRRIWFK